MPRDGTTTGKIGASLIDTSMARGGAEVDVAASRPAPDVHGDPRPVRWVCELKVAPEHKHDNVTRFRATYALQPTCGATAVLDFPSLQARQQLQLFLAALLASLGLALLLQSVLDDFGSGPGESRSSVRPIRLIIPGTVAPAVLVSLLLLVNATFLACAIAIAPAPLLWLYAARSSSRSTSSTSSSTPAG
jgi:hypothetical protein